MRQRTRTAALATRPTNLPEVEPELRSPPPRTLESFSRTGQPLGERALRSARTWYAVKGWIVSVTTVPDHEGPDYHIEAAWEAPDLRVEKVVIGYDAYHWAVGSPEHHAWFHRRMIPGEAVTVLHAPRGKGWTFYGQLEPFITRGERREFAAD